MARVNIGHIIEEVLGVSAINNEADFNKLVAALREVGDEVLLDPVKLKSLADRISSGKKEE